MLNRTRSLSRNVEALLSDRRPPRGGPAPDDLGALATAIELRSMRPGAGMPDPRFVARLERRLREQTQGEFRPRRELSRRGLLQAGGLAAAAAAAGVVADRLAVERAEDPGVAEELAIDGGRWHPVARLDSLPAEGAQRFSTGEVEGVVVNRGGGVEALVAVCTHLGCTLRVDATAGRLRCPCGPAAFGYGGEVLVDAPNQRLRPLPRIPTRVRDGMVEVHVV